MVCEFDDDEERWYANVLASIIRKTNKKSGVLVDVGCKRGMYLAILADEFPKWKFFGLDLYGSDFYTRAKLHNLEYKVLDARELSAEFGKGSIDICTVLALDLETQETRGIVPEILSALKEDGLICKSYMHPEPFPTDTRPRTIKHLEKTYDLELVEKIKQGTVKQGPNKGLDYYFCVFRK